MGGRGKERREMGERRECRWGEGEKGDGEKEEGEKGDWGKEGRRAEGGKGERKKCFCHPTDADDNGCSHILCCRFSWSCACHFK